jgi:hypothetical protein
VWLVVEVEAPALRAAVERILGSGEG